MGDMDKLTEENTEFRKVTKTGNHMQLVVMHVEPTKEIGREVHPHTDQFVRIEHGSGKVEYKYGSGDKWVHHPISENSAVFVPAGTWHNFIADADTPLKLYTLYAPPEHPHE